MFSFGQSKKLALVVTLVLLASLTFGCGPQETLEAPTEEPIAEAPATEAPATEAPPTEAPATEAPATEAPATEIPDLSYSASPMNDASAYVRNVSIAHPDGFPRMRYI